MESPTAYRQSYFVFWFSLIALFSCVSKASPSHDWLELQQAVDGAYTSDLDLATAEQGTAEAVSAFKMYSLSSDQQAAEDFLSASDNVGVESLYRLILTAISQGHSVASLISELKLQQNSDGGFGSYFGFDSDPLSTTFALKALRAAETTSSAAVVYALGYLLNKQNNDGGWGIDNSSSISLSAEIVMTIAALSNYQGVTTAMAEGRGFIDSEQNNDALWGETFESALALSALTTGANTSEDLSASVSSIELRMDANSSWHNDVYTTALALQALKRVSSLAVADTGRGSIKGEVLLAGSSQPIANAVISVLNSNIQTTTNGLGQFILTNVPAGSQTVLVLKQGYSATSVAAIVVNSSSYNVGQVLLGQTQGESVVRGQVYDATTLASIASATVTISGQSETVVPSNASGNFELLGLTPGNYTFQISASGYHSTSGSFDVVSGQNIQITQPLVEQNTPLVDTPLVLTGVVFDGATGLAVESATLVLGGVSFATDSLGAFSSPSIERGEHTLVVQAAGYIGSNYTLSVPAGASGNLGRLTLYQATDTEQLSTFDLIATAVNSVSGLPIVNATFSVVSDSKQSATNSSGVAIISGLNQLNFELEISAVGFESQLLSVTASSYGSAAGTFSLVPEVEDTGILIVSGVLRDELTQLPIAGASITANDIVGVVTDVNGIYTLENIQNTDVLLNVEAQGYISSLQRVTVGSTSGLYTLDLTLAPLSELSTAGIVSVSVAETIEPDTNETIHVEVENLTSEEQNALMLVRVIGRDGENVAVLTPTMEAEGNSSPHFTLQSGELRTFDVTWPVGQTYSADYTIRAEVVEAGTITRDLPLGNVMSVGFADTEVLGVSKFGGGVDIYPPVIQAGSLTPVSIKAIFRNTGNQPLDSGDYILEVVDTSTTTVLHSVTIFSDVLDQNEVGELDFGTWSPNALQGGELAITISRVDGLYGQIEGGLYIGDVAQAQFSIDQTELPEGDSTIAGNIRLTGVDTRLGSSVDPLFVLVKDAVESGAEFTGPSAVNWDQSGNCLGCHIQAQSLAGLGSATGKANVNFDNAKYLLNAMTTAQRVNGSLENSHPQHAKTASLYGVWSLTEWANSEQTFRTSVKALEYLWSRRSTSSGKTYLTEDHKTGWLNTDLAATSLAVVGSVRTIEASESLDELPTDYQWGTSFGSLAGGGNHSLKSVDNGIYIAKSGGRLEFVDTATGVSELLFTSVAGVSGRINGLERDSIGNFWMSTQQGALIQLDSEGNTLSNTTICSSGTGGIVLDSAQENMYVVCHGSRELKRFNLASENITVLTSGGIMNNPYGIAWSADGNLLLANWGGYNVLEFDLEASLLTVFAPGLYGNPLKLTTHTNGDVFVTTRPRGGSSSGVLKIRSDGTAEKVLSGNDPWGVVSHNNQVFIGTDSSALNLVAVNEVELSTDVLDNYKSNMPSIVRYLLDSLNLADSYNPSQALAMMGLAEASKVLESGALLDEVELRISEIATLLRSRQASNGSWRLSGVATDSSGDPLLTALVGIALEYTSPSSDDPMVRNAITFLLNSQSANGSWGTSSGLYTTSLGTTSLVMVYMPKALDRIGGLDVQLSLDMPQNVELLNPSIAPTSSEVLSDQSIHYVWDLDGVTGEGREVDFDLSVLGLELNEVRPVASIAQIAFSNSFTDETITADVDIPSVRGISELALVLQTDKLSYTANELVQITGSVENLGPVFAGGDISLSIRAAAGSTSIAQLPTLSQGILAASDIDPLASDWNTTTTQVGSYEVYGQLVDQNGRVVAEATTPIIIVSTPVSGTASLGGEVYTDKPIYKLSDVVQINAIAGNFTYNATYQSGLGRLTVSDPSGAVVLTESYAIPQLVAGAVYSPQEQLPLLGQSLGDYLVTWQILDATGDNVLVDASAEFTVIVDPLESLAGSILLESDLVYRGDAQTCQFTVDNTGDSELLGITLTKTVTFINAQSVIFTETAGLVLPVAETDISEKALATSGYELGEYACVLEAAINGESRILASALFTVKEHPIKMSGSISYGERARLLVLIDPNTTAQERLFLQSMLDANSWFYTVVDSAQNFDFELNTGGYGVYALLSENVTLDNTTLSSLEINIANGDGLLVSGATDLRHSALENVLGITARANEFYAKGLEVEVSEFSDSWSRAFTQSERVLNFVAGDATVVASYNNDLPNADSETILGPFGAAGRYNVYVLDDHTSLASSIEGTMAVGGNLDLQYFSVGDMVDSSLNADVVTVAGDVSFPTGSVFNGNLVAGGSVASVSNTVVQNGFTITGDSEIGIRFEDEREYLEELSQSLAQLPSNGIADHIYDSYELNGDCSSDLQVFSIDATELASIRTFSTNCIPDGATVVFNIHGASSVITSLGMQALTPIRNKVLFNFPEAETVELKYVAIEGSILAPFAVFEEPAGRVEGQVIARAWSSTNWAYMSIHDKPFTGDLSAAMGPSTQNAVAHNQYQQGLSVFSGFDLFNQAWSTQTQLAPSEANPFAELFLNMLDYVNPDVSLTRAGKVVPLVVTAESIGTQTATGSGFVTLSDNMLPVDMGSLTAASGDLGWQFNFSLQPDEQMISTVYVQLPLGAGEQGQVTYWLQTGAMPNWVTKFEDTYFFFGN